MTLCNMEIDGKAPLKWRVDLHVHTQRYSPCAELLDPALLPNVMVERGLHGVVITEHDHLWSSTEVDELNRNLCGIRIYGGVEISSCNGHFLVIGLDRLDNLKPGASAQSIIQVAKRQGAAVIWAHPLLEYRQIQQPLNTGNIPEGIDAIEVASTVTVGPQAAEARAYARNSGCGMVGGSDAHVLDQVGKAFTLFDHLPTDGKDLAAAICNGRYTIV